MAQKDPALEGVSTIQEEPARVRLRKRGRVRVFRNWCKGCSLCIAFCPQGVFTEDEEHHPLVAYPERCVACQWCTIHCPDFAIIVEEITTSEDGGSK